MAVSGRSKTTVKGLDKLNKKLSKMGKAAKKAGVKVLNIGAFKIHGTAVKSIAASSGQHRQYGNHWSSPPGSPPNTDTGNLVRQLKVVKATDGDPIPYAQVVSSAKYSAALEFGTIRMESRPFLRPAFEEHKEEITEAIADAIREAIQ